MAEGWIPELLMRRLCSAGICRRVHQSQAAVSDESAWHRCAFSNGYAAAASTANNSLMSVDFHCWPSSGGQPHVALFTLIFGLLGLFVCVSVCIEFEVCHFIERTHSSAGFRLLSLRVPTLFKLSRHSFNLLPLLLHFCVIPRSPDRHARPLGDRLRLHR